MDPQQHGVQMRCAACSPGQFLLALSRVGLNILQATVCVSDLYLC
jgi:hypothetical protein